MSKIRQVQNRINEAEEARQAREDKARAEANKRNRPKPAFALEPGQPISKVERQRRINEARGEAAPAPATPPPPVRGKVGAIQADREATPGIELDLESLKGITLEAKVELKKHLVAKYRAHCEAILEAGPTGVADTTLRWWVLWLWDIGAIGEFITHSRRAEALGHMSPISTTFAEFRWRRVSEWAWDEIKKQRSPMPYLEDVAGEMDAMPDSIAGFYAKLLGEHQWNLAQSAETEADATERMHAAQAHFDRAMELAGDAARVKTKLGKVAAWLKDKVIPAQKQEHPTPHLDKLLGKPGEPASADVGESNPD